MSAVSSRLEKLATEEARLNGRKGQTTLICNKRVPEAAEGGGGAKKKQKGAEEVVKKGAEEVVKKSHKKKGTGKKAESVPRPNPWSVK